MKSITLSALLSSSALLFAGAGCKQETAVAPVQDQTATPATVYDDGQDNDHGVAGHSHGAGPHGGTIADWGGGKYHVEFMVDHDKKEATAYILGADEKTPTAIQSDEVQLAIREPAIQVALKPAPVETDPAGAASRFTGTHELLGTVQEYEGTLTGVIDETPYSGDFKEQPHAEDHP